MSREQSQIQIGSSSGWYSKLQTGNLTIIPLAKSRMAIPFVTNYTQLLNSTYSTFLEILQFIICFSAVDLLHAFPEKSKKIIIVNSLIK
jgi:hypothetical protein